MSEPAPLDALAQRFGRVNRVRRVAEAPVHVLTRPDHGQQVYRDELVQNTLRVLRGKQVEGEMLGEETIGVLLDQVYGGGLAEEFACAATTARRQFERDCLQTLRAFASDEALEDIFIRSFDGVEVLPASFEQEYAALSEQSVLAAQALLVPISNGRFHRLRTSGRLRRQADGIHVADVPYDTQFGLRDETAAGLLGTAPKARRLL